MSSILRLNKKTTIPFILYSFSILWIFAVIPVSFGQETPEKEKDQKKRGIFVVPVVYYTPETKIAFGAVGMFYYRPSKVQKSRPSSIKASFVYTQTKQYRFEISPELYIKNDAYRLQGSIIFKKFSDKFFGIGPNTPQKQEEDFTTQRSKGNLDVQRRLWSGLNVGVRYEFESHNTVKKDEDGQLAKENILGSEGGTSSGIGLFLNWDTRDNIYYPMSGNYFQVSSTVFSKRLGGDFHFTEFRLDLRKYFPLFFNHVFALQAYFNFISGEPPFQKLSLVGGQGLMRGYRKGRYRDKSMMAFQMELRLGTWKKVGVVSFFGLGNVSDRIDHFKLEDFKFTVGFGFRFLVAPEERLNLRLDFGFGHTGQGIYITFTEAF